MGTKERGETSEEELIKILNSTKCKSVKINGKNYWISKKVKEPIKQKQTEGGFIPLLGLIPGIIAGIGGAAGIASGVASAVSNSREAIKKQKEIQLLDQQIKTNTAPKETPKEGSGIYLNPSQATALHKYFKNNTDIPPELTKKFKDGVEIEIEGDGVYLKPYKIEIDGDGVYLKPYKNGS